MPKFRWILWFFVAACSVLPSLQLAAAEASVTVLAHGRIWTGNPRQPWAQAIAFRNDGRILQVGTDASVLAQWRRGAQLEDLEGRTVIPGIVDSHMHMLYGAYALHGLNLATPEASITPYKADVIVARLGSYAAEHPDDAVLFARGDFDSTPPNTPGKEILDRAVPDRPVIVHNTSEHALWVNSAALKLAGIGDYPLADPVLERGIIRDASGHPLGVIIEAGMEAIETAVAVKVPRETKLAYLLEAQRHLNSYGITSIVNATGNLDELRLFGTLHERGQLTVRTRTAFGSVALPHRLTPQFLADLEEARHTYHDEWVAANLVKFFLDGSTGLVPPLVYEPHAYEELVMDLDARGYQIATHAIRKDSVHLALDVYEHVLQAHGPHDRRLRVEHLDVIDATDVPRFAKLGVIPDMQPVFCCGEEGGNYDLNHPVVTDPWHSLAASGAPLAFSSDWPCSWPVDPFNNMQQAVTRLVWKSADTDPILGNPLEGAAQSGARPTGKVYTPQERVSAEIALSAYTRGGAYAAFSDDRVGTLEPGKLADLAVLSQNLLEVEPQAIGKTQVLETWVGGRRVYQRPP
ncbi:MAG: amidohydrolase [Gammaproteobacteria bacterium]|nr:amidohydrolase [Gammaproteobacteria bacterium]